MPKPKPKPKRDALDEFDRILKSGFRPEIPRAVNPTAMDWIRRREAADDYMRFSQKRRMLHRLNDPSPAAQFSSARQGVPAPQPMPSLAGIAAPPMAPETTPLPVAPPPAPAALIPQGPLTVGDLGAHAPQPDADHQKALLQATAAARLRQLLGAE